MNTLRCKFNEGDENFSSTGSTNPILHYGRISLEGRDDTQAIPGQTLKGISYNHPLYDSAHFGSLNRCCSVPEAVGVEAFYV